MIYRVLIQQEDKIISFDFDNCETATNWADTGAFYADPTTHICVDYIQSKEEN